MGSRGGSCDNAVAEAFNSIFKAELILNKGLWTSIDDVEIAVAECIDWYNHRRLPGELKLISPVEYETNYRQTTAPVCLTETGLHVPARVLHPRHDLRSSLRDASHLSHAPFTSHPT